MIGLNDSYMNGHGSIYRFLVMEINVTRGGSHDKCWGKAVAMMNRIVRTQRRSFGYFPSDFPHCVLGIYDANPEKLDVMAPRTASVLLQMNPCV